MESLKDIIKAVNGYAENLSHVSISGITTDTREDCSGKLFIPLKGVNFNGHDYIETALKKGAVAALSEKELLHNSDKIIKVKDTLDAYGKIAKYFIERDKIKIIAITGTAGKTTVKELLKHVTGFKGTEKNFNNLIGVPKTILENVFQDKKSDFLIMELGVNCKGEMEKLRDITTPEFVLITNIGFGHLEGFGSVDDVFNEKLKIVYGNSNLEKCILNQSVFKKIEGKKSRNIFKLFGEEEGADAVLLSSVSDFEKGNFIEFSYKNEKLKIHSKLLGTFNALNVLSVFLTAVELGFDKHEIISKTETFKPVKMRCEVYKSEKGVRIINDCYNANFDSFKSAITLFDSVNVIGKKYLVMGDMFELGDMSAELHKQLGKIVSLTGIDYVLCYGDLTGNIVENINGKSRFVKRFKNKSEITDFLNKNLKPEDAVLVKASRAVQFEEITEGIK